MTKLFERLARPGRLAFAVALAGFGVLQFIYGDFIPGRAPEWPSGIPGRLVWAYGSGVLLIAAALAIASGKRARAAAMLTGTMILVWALLRHLPALVANPYGISLTQTGKALALFGGACAVAGFLTLGRCCFGAWLIIGGVQHFRFPDLVATLIPGWIPAHYFWVYFAAIALLAGGTGLILSRTARLAGAMAGTMLLLWVVLLHLPRALAAGDAQLRNEWTAVFEALAFSGIAFFVAGSLRPRPEEEDLRKSPQEVWRLTRPAPPRPPAA